MVDLFGGSRGAPLASYDYFDIISGTGNTTFYGGKILLISGGTTISGMIFNDKTFYSEKITSKGSVTNTDWQNVVNLNIDLPFTVPRIVNGDVIASIPMGTNSLSSITSPYLYFDAYLYLINSTGTATLLVSGASLLYRPSHTNSDEAHSIIQTIKLPLSNQSFKANEKLRLTLNMFSKGTDATKYLCGFGHDPKNRIDNNEANTPVSGTDGPIIEDTTNAAGGRYATDTNLLLVVPFKIDVEV